MSEERILDAARRNIITPEEERNILSYRERLVANGVPVIYNLRHVRKIFGIRYREQDRFFGDGRNELYQHFTIPKRSGGVRGIEAPVERLKLIQRWIKDEILDTFAASDHAFGFRKGVSIVDNARMHTCKELVINLDLQDFFPSVVYAEVFKVFLYIGYRKDVAHLLTKLCTNAGNVLPQGSPASPALSNLVLLKLDKRLSRLAQSVGGNYSRYADDLTFSGKRSLTSIVPLVEKIVREEGYRVNRKKTRLQYASGRQEVTGLIVNNGLSVSPSIKNELKNAIYFSSKYGVADHMRCIGCDKSFYKEHLYGLAYFVKMVEPDAGCAYLEKLDGINW